MHLNEYKFFKQYSVDHCPMEDTCLKNIQYYNIKETSIHIYQIIN